MKGFKEFKPVEESNKPLLPKQQTVAKRIKDAELAANRERAGHYFGKMVRAQKVGGKKQKVEDKGSAPHHQFQKTFKHAMQHAKTHQDLDTDGDVDNLEKMVPDEITGTEKNQKALQKKVKQKHDAELKHTRKGVAFESADIEKELTEGNPVNKAKKKEFVRQVGLKAMKAGKVDPARGHIPQRAGREVLKKEVSKADAEKILGGPVKTKPTGPAGKHPLGYRMARSAAKQRAKEMEKKLGGDTVKKEKPVQQMSTSALKQYWNRHKDQERPAPAFAAKLRQIAAELRRRKALQSESADLQESHFKVGDKVACLRSGMKGEVVKVDAAGKGKYYTVKRSDGSMMKFAPNELKKVVGEAKATPLSKARKDAMRAIRKDKDLAFKGDDDDVKATDDDVKAASKNPVMQLRRISDLEGTGEMEFKNGKKGKLSSVDAKKLLKVFDTLRMPKEKEDFQNAIGKSLEDLKKVLKTPPAPKAPFKQKIKGSRYMTSFKWDNED